MTIQADLGLPSLPGTAGGRPGNGGLDLPSVLSGTSTMRVWSSPDGARVALHGTLDETDVVTDGDQVWIWSAADRTVTRLALPVDHAGAGWARAQGATGAGQPTTPEQWLGSDSRAAIAALTPAQLSRAVLAALSPSTTVTTGPNVTVAGRPAYQLVLVPRDAGTLVGSVTIAIDAAERVPTRVTVTSTVTGRPALTVGFTDVRFTAPDPSTFTFTPPPGATVKEEAPTPGATASAPAMGPSSGTPTVVGTGWASVLVLADAAAGASASGGASPSGTAGTSDAGVSAPSSGPCPRCPGPGARVAC